jgi:hypothetical protein
MSSQADSRRDEETESLHAQKRSWADKLKGRVAAVQAACATRLSSRTSAVTKPIANALQGRSRGFRLFVTVLLATSLVIAPVTVVYAAGLDPIVHIPSAEPGVDKTYDDTYRVLANNDVDVDPNNVNYAGYFEDDFPSYPVDLGQATLSPSQSLRYATATDVYITDISDFNSVPYQDEWNLYSSLPSYTETQFLLVHTNNTYGGPKSNDGEWFVRVTNQYGDWRPVYNADVKWDPDAEEHYVSNPDEALVHQAKHESTIARNLHAARQYTQYAQNSGRVAIPTMNGRELYPTSDGASMSRKWGQSNFNTVRDSWVGINHVTGSVWYRDSYVSGGAPIRGAYVPYDHRAVAPADYSRSATCTKTHTHSNSTHSHTYPKTEWAEYDLLDSTANVTSVRLDRPGFTGDSEWNQFGKITWLGIDNKSSRDFKYPRGRYTLTATLEVTTEVETRWGVTSSKCSEWDRTSVATNSHTAQYSVPVTITDWNSTNLEIDVAHIDGAGHDRLAVRWKGDQDLPNDPWKKISVNIDNKTVDLNSPWRFYGISRNDEVEVRTGGGSTVHNATHTRNDRWPAIYHYETSVANVTASFPQKNEDNQVWGYTKPVDGQVSTTLPGAPLPATVNDPDNDPPTDLYTQYVIDVRSSDLATGESVTVRASNPFGAPLNGKTAFGENQVKISSQPYEKTVLQMTEVNASSTGGSHKGILVLTDTDGNSIKDRVITVTEDDGTTSTVTTDNNGRAKIVWDGSVLRARYDGDVFWSPGDPYYQGDQLLHILPPSPSDFEAVGTVGEYISASISNVLIFVEWLALGIFALWWVRMRRRTSKGDSG